LNDFAAKVNSKVIWFLQKGQVYPKLTLFAVAKYLKNQESLLGWFFLSRINLLMFK